MILRKLFLKIIPAVFFVTSLTLLPSIAWSMAGKDHTGDMVEVLIGDRRARVPDLRHMCLKVTATIDNFKVIKGLPVGNAGHRVYGHWGFSGSIPFNKSPLKNVLDEIENKARSQGKSVAEAKAARAAAKQKIVDAWKDDVNKILELVEKETGLNGRQAKGLAGLLYDIHILGDWTGVKLESLQAADDIGKDVLKNIRRMLGNNSHIAKEIEREINDKIKYCIRESKCKAEAIRNILKNSEKLRQAISVRLAEKYPIVSKLITSKPLWKAALTISALSNHYNSTMKKIPEKFRMPAQAGLITGIISSGIYGYKVINGDIDPLDAAELTISNTMISASSVYVSDAILLKIGDKYALQTIAKSGSSNLCKAFGTAVNLGLATFVFDETQVIYNFSKGNLTHEEFYEETGKAVLRTGGSFAATYCSVALGLTPTGPAVMFIAIGGYILADLAINNYEEWEARKYVTIDDLLWQLPFSVKQKKSIFNVETLYDGSIVKMSDPKRSSILDIDYKDNKDIMGVQNSKEKKIRF